VSGAFAVNAASKARQVGHGAGDVRVRQQGKVVERRVHVEQGRGGTVGGEILANEGSLPCTVAVMYFDAFLVCGFGAGIFPVVSCCIVWLLLLREAFTVRV